MENRMENRMEHIKFDDSSAIRNFELAPAESVFTKNLISSDSIISNKFKKIL
jgi:hypothetical protein